MIVWAFVWHAHYDAIDQGVACVMWLLTPFFRIVQRERNGEWIGGYIEGYEPPGEWRGGSEVVPVFVAPGSKKSVVRIAHQQNVVPVPRDLLKSFPPKALDRAGLPLGSKLGSHQLDE